MASGMLGYSRHADRSRGDRMRHWPDSASPRVAPWPPYGEQEYSPQVS